MKSPKQLFTKLSVNEKIDACDVLDYALNKQSRTIALTLSSGTVISRRLVDMFSKDLKKIYRLNECAVHIFYRDATLSQDFFDEYFENIAYCLNARQPAYGYLLMQSRLIFSDDALTLSLAHGGSDLLLRNKCDEFIARMIKDETGLSVTVTFSDNLQKLDFSIPDPIYPQNDKPSKKDTAKKEPTSKSAYGSEVLVGKPIKGQTTPICNITSDTVGKIIIEGDVISTDSRLLNNKKMLVRFNITDLSSSISCKFFTTPEKYETLSETLKSGAHILVQGDVRDDKYERDIIVMVSNINTAVKPQKTDSAPVKRVELHLHTQMSAMDGVSSAKSLVKRAIDWGMSAVAITDHGVVQSFPDAVNAKGKNPIKILYGVEAYLVSDSISAVTGAQDVSLDGTFVVFDIETTGLHKSVDVMTEIGAVKISNGKIVDRFSTFVDPQRPIPQNIIDLTGITDEMVQGAPDEKTAVTDFLKFCDGAPVIAHNAKFDTGFIRAAASRAEIVFDNPIICTLQLAKALLPELKRHKLNIIAEHLHIENPNHHRAVNDAEVTSAIWFDFVTKMKEHKIDNITQINRTLGGNIDIKRAKTYHAIILVKTQSGLKNLYKIITESHLEYFHRRPRVPKSLYLKYSSGLMIGSACEAGELYQAILDEKPTSEIEEIAAFYDYLEIQPLGNNAFMLRDGKVNSEEELKDINRKIIALGEKLGKLTVATCDVHFLDPEDEVFRRILMAGQGFDDADNQAPLYFRNTEEMLNEFSYLGKERAYEVVVENTNKIADMIDEITPLRSGTYPPSIENSAEQLQSLCREKAERIYGLPLPSQVKERMDKELVPIIKYGFDVMYMIAQKLVKKSNDDGYIVGSRGSVGSSFIAYLAGITEINSLPAHYICSKCKYIEFPAVLPGQSGCDLPDKACPECGTPLTKDGHDIPFETFLGFEGDKAPDIDLNFSGDYQAIAHKYTEELFGTGYVFKAGTIATVADKTAYGYVKKYFDEKNQVVHDAEIERLKIGCTGIKRTTGQHPGGIIVCPKTMDIHDFTPVQHPADDVNSDVVTTHFDYHSIHDNLLKLDILGHDDPTVIRMLEDLTGTKVQNISLDDRETMSLFSCTDALGVTPEQIASEVGTYAIPEFGTRIVRNMLVETKPKSFSELIRISGLSHGTDVWFSNAQDLVQAGTCTLNSCICTRDDIMAFLISKNMPPKLAFTIMESVRKGKGLKPEWEEEMRAHDVPDWYIQSCLKIKYMFPKAHAAAYVTNAFRIAWYKVHYPIEFYIAYYTVRADDFDYELMSRGPEVVAAKITEYERLGKQIGAREKNILTILEVCREMYARNIYFTPIDLYASEATRFTNVNGKILPPLSSISGLGGVAAQAIVEARKDGEFFSIDDLQTRAKVSKTVIELLSKNGCLKGLPESSQMTFFDM